MKKDEYDSFPRVRQLGQREKDKLIELARKARDTETHRYSGRCLSGADIAEAPMFGILADVYACLADGCDADAVLAWADRKWREYAESQQQRVASAPKLRMGPSSGHSAMGHRWVSADAFEPKARHVRAMLSNIFAQGVR